MCTSENDVKVGYAEQMRLRQKLVGIHLVLYVLCAPSFMGVAAGANDGALNEARSLRYQDYQGRGFRLLDQAVHADPHDVESWMELLDWCGSTDFGERASRSALSLNPYNPRLLIARVRLLSPAAALDVLGRTCSRAGI